MIGKINSISICHLHHMKFGPIGLEPNNAASQLLTTMLTKTRIMEIYEYMEMSKFAWCDWLYASRNDGKPRALRLHSGSFLNAKNLIEQIKKDFSKAIHPVSFFVYLRVHGRRGGNDHWQWQDISLDNGQTNERLVVKTIDPPNHRFFWDEKLLISRYPMETNLGWIQANEQEIMEWNFDDQNRRICFELE